MTTKTQNRNSVLLIYPSPFKISGLHVGISSLSGVLKEGGYNVKVFDTTFYDSNDSSNWDKIRGDLEI